jgi:hypothetical protein
VSRLLLAAGLLPLAVVAACASEASSSSAPADAKVPAGVAKQYSALADEVAEHGGQTETGDWTVSYVVEAAEPWYESHDGGERFRKPAPGETHHIEIIPTETATGRIVPDVPITLQVLDSDGRVVDEKRLHFLYSTFFHYANNVEIPDDGKYTLRATLGAPGFARHGEEGEKPALSEGAEVEFENVELVRG